VREQTRGIYIYYIDTMRDNAEVEVLKRLQIIFIIVYYLFCGIEETEQG
jgi:hypothetical protein